MSDVVDAVLEAIARRHWDRLEPLLHPYVHWTDASGATVRGRRNAMSRLMSAPVAARPRSFEVRDGQIYRWHEAAESDPPPR